MTDHDRETYRAVYTVRLASGVYVLHCFQKKSSHGIKTPRREIALIKRQLAAAIEQDRELIEAGSYGGKTMREGIIAGGDNVFADIGHPRPEEALDKARLAHRIATIITQRGLTEAQAAHLLGTPQSKVSLVVTGQLDGFTIDRLLRFLTALDE